jgi:VanZ family protein
MGLIFFLSSHPGDELPKYGWMQFDKVLHTLEYAGLGFFLMVGLTALVERPWLAVLLAALIGLAYGISDEYHQSFVPHRQGNDPGDMAADLLGATLGAIGWLVLARLLRRPNTKKERHVQEA